MVLSWTSRGTLSQQRMKRAAHFVETIFLTPLLIDVNLMSALISFKGASSKWSVSEVQVQTLSVFFGNTRKENPRFGGARRGRAGLRYQEREALNRPESDPVFDDNVQVFGCF